MADDPLLTPREIHQRYPQFGEKLQENHRKKGTFAPFIQIGRHVYYRESTFERWLDDRESTTPRVKVTP